MNVVPTRHHGAAVESRRQSWLKRSVLAAGIVALCSAAACAGPIRSTTADSEGPSTESTHLDADRAVETASLIASDLPNESTETGDIEPLTRADDECRIISSSPYLAGVSSPRFDYTDAGVAKRFHSIVTLEPSDEIAKKIAAAFVSREWMERCSAPRHLEADPKFVAQGNAASDCDLSLVAHTDVAIPTDDLPAGVTGWTNDVTWRCEELQLDVVFSYENYLTHVGPIVIEILATGQSESHPSGQAPPIEWTSGERRVIVQLADRARSLGQS